MILVSPQSAALALGTQCKTPTGTGDEQLLEQLRLLTPRVAAALNVMSLSRGNFVDYFSFPSSYAASKVPFRLSNAFLVGNVTVAGVQDAGAVTVDREMGTVTVDGFYPDVENAREVSIAYTSGFAVAADGPSVHANAQYRPGIGVPDWLEGIVSDFLMNWRRNQLAAPQVTKEYGFLPTLNLAVDKDLRARIYSRYMRQRDGMQWPTRYTVAA